MPHLFNKITKRNVPLDALIISLGNSSKLRDCKKFVNKNRGRVGRVQEPPDKLFGQSPSFDILPRE